MSTGGRGVDLPADVVELLRDEPDLLAIADALKATQERRRRRRAGVVVTLIAAAIAAAVVGLPQNSPGRNDVIKRAAKAAAGSRLTVVASVAARQGRVELEGHYDPTRGQGHAVVHLSGVEKLAGGRLPQIRELLDQFATDYRRTLESGRAELAATTPSTLWLTLMIKGLHYQVALDRDTYRPILIRVVPRGTTATITLDITSFLVS